MKEIVKKVVSALKPTTPTDQRTALASRHVESQQKRSELRIRCDELAVDGGEDFERACADIASLDVKIAAEASAIQKLDEKIAAEAAAAEAARRKALRDQAVEKVKPWLTKAKSLHADLAPLVDATKALADINDSQHGYAAYIVGFEGKQTIYAPIGVLRMVNETFSSILDRLEHDDDLAERINKYQAPKGA